MKSFLLLCIFLLWKSACAERRLIYKSQYFSNDFSITCEPFLPLSRPSQDPLSLPSPSFFHSVASSARLEAEAPLVDAEHWPANWFLHYTRLSFPSPFSLTSSFLLPLCLSPLRIPSPSSFISSFFSLSCARACVYVCMHACMHLFLSLSLSLYVSTCPFYLASPHPYQTRQSLFPFSAEWSASKSQRFGKRALKQTALYRL